MDLRQEIVNLYSDGQSGLAISEDLCIPVWKVYEELKKAGIKRRSNKINSRRYKLDDTYFNEINTETKAYWLGLMYADGYLFGSNGVGISLNVRDRILIDSFRDALEATYPIHTYSGVTAYGHTEYSRLHVVSDQLYNDLTAHGCVENKTLVLQPPLIDEDLYSHFIRGYFDGDGTVSTHTKNSFKIGLVGTFDLLSWVNEVVPESGTVCPVKGKLCFEWITACRKAQRNMEWIYKDAEVYLERKYVKAVELTTRFYGTGIPL